MKPPELLELSVSPFSRRSRSVVVRHTDTALTRGLEPRERVEVRDGSTRWTATVQDIHFELTDTLYRLELGPASAVGASTPLVASEAAPLLALLRQVAPEQAVAGLRHSGSEHAGRARA